MDFQGQGFAKYPWKLLCTTIQKFGDDMKVLKYVSYAHQGCIYLVKIYSKNIEKYKNFKEPFWIVIYFKM